MRWLRDGWGWAKQRISDRREFGVRHLERYSARTGAWHPGRQRWIYEFFDGSRVRSADPLRAHLELLDRLDGKPGAAAPDPADTVTDGTAEALRRVVAAVRAAFNVAPAAVDDEGNESGLDDRQCLELLRDFTDWFRVTSPGRWPVRITPPAGV
jgi:hypothetical protein